MIGWKTNEAEKMGGFPNSCIDNNFVDIGHSSPTKPDVEYNVTLEQSSVRLRDERVFQLDLICLSCRSRGT